MNLLIQSEAVTRTRTSVNLESKLYFHKFFFIKYIKNILKLRKIDKFF